MKNTEWLSWLEQAEQDEEEKIEIATLYADNRPIIQYLSNDNDEIAQVKGSSYYHEPYLRYKRYKQEQLKEEVLRLRQEAQIAEMKDSLTKSINDYVDTIHALPLTCPICGREPRAQYYKNWHVWEYYCRRFGKMHFVITGKPYQPQFGVVKEWNKYVEGVTNGRKLAWDDD